MTSVEIFGLGGLALIVVTGLAYIGKKALDALIESGVKHGLDARLEGIRSDLRNSEEHLKAQIRAREVELNALQQSALSGLAGRRAMIEKRRLEAADNVWESIVALRPVKNVAA